MSLPDRSSSFPARLQERVQRLRSRLVVGLDPVVEWFPAPLRDEDVEEGLVRFCRGVLEAVQETVAAVKPQIAFFERHGWRGLRALQRTVEAAGELQIPVILDIKRGDIGSTARAYADAYLGDDPETPGPFVDAVTVNPYLGTDSIQPFLERARTGRRGLFVLTRTSNPGGEEFQGRETEGEALYLAVARAANRWGGELASAGERYTPVGLVVGATYPQELQWIREAAPSSILLLPGYGAQGGKLDALAPVFDDQGLGALVASSRSILFAFRKAGEEVAEWEAAVSEAARRSRDEIEEVLASA